MTLVERQEEKTLSDILPINRPNEDLNLQSAKRVAAPACRSIDPRLCEADAIIVQSTLREATGKIVWADSFSTPTLAECE